MTDLVGNGLGVRHQPRPAPSAGSDAPVNRKMTFEYHLAIAEHDYERLRRAALTEGVSLSVILRRMVDMLASLSDADLRRIGELRPRRPAHLVHVRLTAELHQRLTAALPTLRRRLAGTLRAAVHRKVTGG